MAKIERYCAPGVFEPADLQPGRQGDGVQGGPVPRRAGRLRQGRRRPLHRGDFKGQAREAFRAIKALVEARAARWTTSSRSTPTSPTCAIAADLVPVREEFFGKKGPASTLVQVAALAHPDWLIEIEAIAVV